MKFQILVATALLSAVVLVGCGGDDRRSAATMPTAPSALAPGDDSADTSAKGKGGVSRPQEVGVVQLFGDADFRGAGLDVMSSVENLAAIGGPCAGGNFNDCISSIAIPNGMFVTIYADTGFRGASTTLRNSVSNLSSISGPCLGNFNDCISSIEVGGELVTPTPTPVPTGGCETRDVPAGGSLSGSLTATDCTVSGRGYTDLIRFSGTAGAQVTITMSSVAFDTYLFLLSPGNVVVASDDDSGGNLNSLIRTTLPTSGTYTIQATSFANGATGSYTVTVSGGTSTGVPPAGGGVRVFTDADYRGTSLSVGSSIENLSFVSGPCAGGNFNDCISSIEIPSGTSVTIYGDAGYRGTSRTLTASVSNLSLTPGPCAGGNFNDCVSSIQLGGSSTSGGCEVFTVAVGGSVNGNLTTNDCQASGRGYTDQVRFSASAGARIQITMSSVSFDTYLILLSPSGSTVASDDDSGAGTDSLIDTTLQSSGTYTIYATTYASGATGSYTVTVR